MNSKTFRKTVALVFVCLFVLLTTGVTEAFAALTNDEQSKIDSYKSQQADLETKIAENQQKMDSLKDDIEQQEAYVTTLQSQISNYQDQINLQNDNIKLLEVQKSGIQTDIDTLDKQIEDINQEIKKNEQEQIKIQGNIDDIYVELENRLCDIYMYGNTNELEMLLNSTDFKSFLITIELSSNIAKHDDEIVTGLNDKIAEIDTLNAEHTELIEEIEDTQAQYQLQIDALDEKEADINENKQVLEKAQSEIQVLETEAKTYLDELDQQSAAYKAMIAQYEADVAEFDAMIDGIVAQAEARRLEQQAAAEAAARAAAEAAQAANNSGDDDDDYSGGETTYTPPVTTNYNTSYIWPLQYSDVYISSGYGYRSDPATGSTLFHGGVDSCRSSGTYGANISASASGTVLTAAYMASGYGYYVLLDHGNGVYTLYGHNSQLLVSEGDYVVQGQTIAYAGATGYATGAHCHFEVRVNGERVNPLGYASP